MRLGGTAAYLLDIHDANKIARAIAWAEERNLPVVMIGSGSNIIWRDEGFAGLLLVNKITGYTEHQEDKDCLVTIGAGENWDEMVGRTVASGLTGIEALSLIPGTAGATPVQNVGAYGQEIAQTLVSVEAYDMQTKRFVQIQNADCAFGYRASRFKAQDRGRFFITAVTLRLRRGTPKPPYYPALEEYLLKEHGIAEHSPEAIRNAVIAIRQSKLPDPAEVANNGSFFANPIISVTQLLRLQAAFDEVPHWPHHGDVKISAAWLLERAGFKNFHDPETGMATWPAQPLVFVNEHAHSTAQLLEFRQKVLDTVQQRFDIVLQQEPELLP